MFSPCLLKSVVVGEAYMLTGAYRDVALFRRFRYLYEVARLRLVVTIETKLWRYSTFMLYIIGILAFLRLQGDERLQRLVQCTDLLHRFSLRIAQYLSACLWLWSWNNLVLVHGGFKPIACQSFEL